MWSAAAWLPLFFTPLWLAAEPGNTRKKLWRCVMPLEPRDVPGLVQEENLGSLRSCLVEGDAEQRHRERRIRRRALISSILIQTGALALLILLPLFGKTEHIALARNYVPIPPYGPHTSHPEGERRSANPRPTNPDSRFIFDAP